MRTISVRRSIFAVVLAVLCLCSALTVAIPTAKAERDRGISGLIDGILSTGAEKSVSDWIKNDLAASPEISEWYAIGATLRYPSEDISAYAQALEKYLSENTVYSATTRQKYGLALIACGRSDSPYLNGLIDSTAGKQGIMSYIFALHLATNGAGSDTFRPETLIPILLKLECPDGGWSLTGQTADTDVTAMTVQALAPYYNAYSRVKTAVDTAISKLSEMQLSDGGYTSFGSPNPESASQVILALHSLGIDPLSDPRFIKGDKTLLDGITKYKLSDGSYCHTEGGASNHAATSQAFLAFVCLEKQDSSPFFLFTELPAELPPLDSSLADSQNKPSTESTPSVGGDQSDRPNTDTTADKGKGGYKLPVCIAIASVTVAACVLLFVLKKRSPQNYILVAAVGAILTAAVILTDLSTPDSYYGKEIVKDDPIGSVSMEIICDPTVNSGNGSVILEKTEIKIEEGETVYDILLQITRQKGIKLDASGKSATGTAYVRGIGDLYEFDHGDLSGWIYTVNGQRMLIDCDSCVLKDGDTVVWKYSLSLTE